jgi:hypothetical protein
MVIEIDRRPTPPRAALRGAHDFRAVEKLITLAGAHAHDSTWLASLGAVHAFAKAQGWTDSAGAIRRCVEWTR